MVYIDAVHYEVESGSYEGIIRVKYTNDLNEEATKDVHIQKVIDFLDDSTKCVKTKYNIGSPTFPLWIEGADVEVVDDRYLRSKSNKSSVDNLENLPRY